MTAPDAAIGGDRGPGETHDLEGEGEAVTVCTLTRDRTAHLVEQVEGLLRSRRRPAVHVVAVMGGEDPRTALPATPWQTRFVSVAAPPGTGLPLARARNVAMEAAPTERVVMLDVDCIPSPDLVAAHDEALRRFDGIVMGEVAYLPPQPVAMAGPDPLAGVGSAHPSRPAPPPDGQLRTTADWQRFWSLSFGIRRRTWQRIGGFDPGYVGYGGEDTDFALRALRAGVPFAWLGGARADHQHHDVHDPPVQHLASIVVNAHRFRRRWGTWPMEGWLGTFRDLGLVDWDPLGERLDVVREPTLNELDATRQPTPTPVGAARRP